MHCFHQVECVVHFHIAVAEKLTAIAEAVVERERLAQVAAHASLQCFIEGESLVVIVEHFIIIVLIVFIFIVEWRIFIINRRIIKDWLIFGCRHL